MRRMMMKSKIHRARVTAASVDYEGSITIDAALLDAAGILPYEQVHVFDITNGERLVTYAIAGGDGEICINGAAAKRVGIDDLVIIVAFGGFSTGELESFEPRIVKVDSENHISSATGQLPDSKLPDTPHTHKHANTHNSS
jgi:aspartate 1-decarboxylase